MLKPIQVMHGILSEEDENKQKQHASLKSKNTDLAKIKVVRKKKKRFAQS